LAVDADIRDVPRASASEDVGVADPEFRVGRLSRLAMQRGNAGAGRATKGRNASNRVREAFVALRFVGFGVTDLVLG
jgi:hypothetical protein